MYNLTEEEIAILKDLTAYPKLYSSEYDNELNYLASLKLAAKHSTGWTKGSEHQKAMTWLKSLKPQRIKTCKGCGA